MDIYISISSFVLEIFLFMAIGYFFSSRFNLTFEKTEPLSKFILYLYVPSLIISSTMEAKNIMVNSIELFLYVVVIFFSLLGIGNLYCFIRKTTKENKKMLLSSIVLMNCGYIGIPSALIIGGNELKKYATFYAVLYTPAIIIYANYLFGKNTNKLKNIFLNIYIVSFFIGILLGYIQQYININPLENVINSISNATPTIMLLLTGIYMNILIKNETYTPHVLEAAILRVISGIVSIILFTLIFAPQNKMYQAAIILQTITPIGILPYFIAVDSGYKNMGFGMSIIISNIFWLLIILPFIIYMFHSHGIAG